MLENEKAIAYLKYIFFIETTQLDLVGILVNNMTYIGTYLYYCATY